MRFEKKVMAKEERKGNNEVRLWAKSNDKRKKKITPVDNDR